MAKGSHQKIARWKLEVEGIVQGVGFRPFVFRLAKKHGLCGLVFNHEKGVTIEVEGKLQILKKFTSDLKSGPPPLARIESIDVTELEPIGYPDFRIAPSAHAESGQTLISPDIATCGNCLRELFSPSDRRFFHPFINCTDCGPRYTIILRTPYDRPNTTMQKFKMCKNCAKEYEAPLDRRFHAQPIACPNCGPKVWLTDKNGRKIKASEPIKLAQELILKGEVVCVKGVGGFHLAVRAGDEKAVKKLRMRKYREDKPFAVMVRDLDVARELCCVNDAAEEIFLGTEAPILVLPRRSDSPIAETVAPRQKTLGLFLPYSPIHHLLFRGDLRYAVLTSGNLSDEPICHHNEDAFEHLKNIADYYLLHDRDIHIRCDDSVLKMFNDRPYFIRRSRGYAPNPIELGISGTSVLAVGAHLKNTICLTKGNKAFMSHHIGDLDNLPAFNSFLQATEHIANLFSIEPKIVACDLHPHYLSSQHAKKIGLGLVEVQHHHAHIASCLAEHKRDGPVIGLSLDGVGYGPDGTIWGGEILVCTLSDFKRAGYIKPLPMPTGEMAIKEPWRMAVSYLLEAFGEIPGEIEWDVEKSAVELMKQICKKRVNAPETTSAGRLFDAIAAIIGVRTTVNYEGQAAIELEQLAEPGEEKMLPFKLESGSNCVILNFFPTIREIVALKGEGTSAEKISGMFHKTFSQAFFDATKIISEKTGIKTVALSGGVFQNLLLLSQIKELSEQAGFEVLVHRLVPTNDGGLSLGQAAVAIAKSNL